MGSKMNLFGNIANSALTEIGTFASDQMRQQQVGQQASMLKVQAANIRNQAKANAQKGNAEAQAIDRQKSRITENYNKLRARNLVNLGAGNVDMTSGSALKVQEGNAEAYAQDMAENKYNVAVKQWETEQARKTAFYEADQYDAQASYLNKTKGNVATSLLTAHLAGAQSFLGGMGMPTSGLASISGLIGGGKQKFYDPALQQMVSSPVRH